MKRRPYKHRAIRINPSVAVVLDLERLIAAFTGIIPEYPKEETPS